MKHLLVILTILICAASLNAQESKWAYEPDDKAENHVSLVEVNYQPNIDSLNLLYQQSAGDYVRNAGNKYILGSSLMVGGSGIVYLGSRYKPKNIEDDTGKTIMYCGGAMVLIGFIFDITGHFELVKAGNKMNSDAITISSSKEGIGVAARKLNKILT